MICVVSISIWKTLENVDVNVVLCIDGARQTWKIHNGCSRMVPRMKNESARPSLAYSSSSTQSVEAISAYKLVPSSFGAIQR